MTGLKRGTVALAAHQAGWHEQAEQTIAQLKQILGDTAVDIQHVGSTAIARIHAKPILDLAVGVYSLADITPHLAALQAGGFVCRGQDIAGQLLLVKGDFEKDWRTHHIHVVQWNGAAWHDYIDFRDHLNAVPGQAMRYDALKQALALQFPTDRIRYTAGKQPLIEQLLREARLWRGSRQR